MFLDWHFFLKIFLSALFGGVVGLERELRGKPAGLKTNMLISLGSCLYVLIGLSIAGVNPEGSEIARIVGQIITGVGFLGAGTIMHRENQVVGGLTTAAAIWVVAAIGAAVGIGLYLEAGLVSLITAVFLHFLNEVAFAKKPKK
jgi:putative Mg2+ transporter-C (MgtC) family protein